MKATPNVPPSFGAGSGGIQNLRNKMRPPQGVPQMTNSQGMPPQGMPPPANAPGLKFPGGAPPQGMPPQGMPQQMGVAQGQFNQMAQGMGRPPPPQGMGGLPQGMPPQQQAPMQQQMAMAQGLRGGRSGMMRR